MIHRILEGNNAVDVTRDLLKANNLTAAFDLAPIFVNLVRVVSLPAVITPIQVEAFDDVLAKEQEPRKVFNGPMMSAPT